MQEFNLAQGTRRGAASIIGWRRNGVDPDNPIQGFHAPFYGARCKCFAITDQDRHKLDAPPQPGTAAYLQAFREVRSKGIAPELMGTVCSLDALP
ncbi:MAG: hypothetical protein LC808_01495, partial [Actinobacteria bacterium]|nr:hypothetical protein [Actinomycetota bacterium]